MSHEDEVKCRCGYVRVFLPAARESMSVHSAARSAGWRIWSGETQGGETKTIILCPVCADTATPEQRAELTGWDATCDTCYATMQEDWEDEGEFTEKMAKDWVREHECEPDAHAIAPPVKSAVA